MPRVVWRRLLGGLACALALIAPAQAQRIPFNPGNDNFAAEGLLRGVAATQAQCAGVPHAVWARVPTGEAECIRYWASGLTAGTRVPRVLVYIPSDQMAFDQPDSGYASRSPKTLQALADGMGSRAAVPFILLSRPGIF